MTYQTIHKTFADVKELTDYIRITHCEFAGYITTKAKVSTTLRQARDFLQSEKAARSANFEARHYAPGAYFDTIITIGLTEDGKGFTFEERMV